MRVNRRAARGRGGIALVETALLFTVYAMFLFGIFEYTRYLYLLQLACNGARDSARLAACNLSNPDAAWTGTAFTNDPDYGSGRPYFTVPAVTDNLMGTTTTVGRLNGLGASLRKRLNGAMPIAQIYPVDAATLYADPPTFRPKEQNASTRKWNSASFPEKLVVRITGDYDPIAPLLLQLPAAARRVDIKVVVNSEG